MVVHNIVDWIHIHQKHNELLYELGDPDVDDFAEMDKTDAAFYNNLITTSTWVLSSRKLNVVDALVLLRFVNQYINVGIKEFKDAEIYGLSFSGRGSNMHESCATGKLHAYISMLLYT